jgi:hypothetical protein
MDPRRTLRWLQCTSRIGLAAALLFGAACTGDDGDDG